MSEFKRKASNRNNLLLLLPIAYLVGTCRSYYQILGDIFAWSYYCQTDYKQIGAFFMLIAFPITTYSWVLLGKRFHDLNMRAWWILAIILTGAVFNVLGQSLPADHVELGMFLGDVHILIMLVICLLPARLEGNRFIDNQSMPEEGGIVGRFFSPGNPELKINLVFMVIIAAVVLVCAESITCQMIKKEIKEQNAKLERVFKK